MTATISDLRAGHRCGRVGRVEWRLWAERGGIYVGQLLSPDDGLEPWRDGSTGDSSLRWDRRAVTREEATALCVKRARALNRKLRAERKDALTGLRKFVDGLPEGAS